MSRPWVRVPSPPRLAGSRDRADGQLLCRLAEAGGSQSANQEGGAEKKSACLTPPTATDPGRTHHVSWQPMSAARPDFYHPFAELRLPSTAPAESSCDSMLRATV